MKYWCMMNAEWLVTLFVCVGLLFFVNGALSVYLFTIGALTFILLPIVAISICEESM